jgi:predicted HD phosphohydrolase
MSAISLDISLGCSLSPDVVLQVMAKRYLTAVDEGYYEGLSWNSKNTLKYQVRLAS